MCSMPVVVLIGVLLVVGDEEHGSFRMAAAQA
jgi:hypothetical protein